MPVIISGEEKRKTENSSVSDEVTGTREWRKFYDGTGEEKSIHELKGLASYDDAPKDWGDLSTIYREPTLHGIADIYVARAFVRSDSLDAPGETEWGDDLMLSRSQLRLHCPTTSPEERKFNFLLIEEKAGGSFEKVVSQVVITVPADKNISDPWLADWMTAPPPGPSGLASFSRYLLPVEIKITEKGKSPPTDGVCVKTGTTLEYKLSDSDLGLPTSAITWKSSQLKGDGSYTAWAAFGTGGVKMDYTEQTSGIFKVRASITAGGSNIDIDYLRSKDEPNATGDSSGAYNEFFRAGKPDFVGVVKDAPQLAIRNQARGSLGSTKWAYAATITPGYGVDLTLTFKDSWKCNIFVFMTANDAGATMPTTVWRDYLISLPPWVDRNVPFSAEKLWDSGVTITGWTWKPNSYIPQPGDPVAKFLGVAHGHTGILDYDGAWISAGEKTVNKALHLETNKSYVPNFRHH